MTVPSWAAWRSLAHLHQRRSCTACDGEGRQAWMIEASVLFPTRWYYVTCRECAGRGWGR